MRHAFQKTQFSITRKIFQQQQTFKSNKFNKKLKKCSLFQKKSIALNKFADK